MNSVEVFISCHSDLSAFLSFRPSGASGEICGRGAIVFSDWDEAYQSIQLYLRKVDIKAHSK